MLAKFYLNFRKDCLRKFNEHYPNFCENNDLPEQVKNATAVTKLKNGKCNTETQDFLRNLLKYAAKVKKSPFATLKIADYATM